MPRTATRSRNFDYVLEQAARGRLPLGKLVTNVVPADQIDAILERFAGGRPEHGRRRIRLVSSISEGPDIIGGASLRVQTRTVRSGRSEKQERGGDTVKLVTYRTEGDSERRAGNRGRSGGRRSGGGAAAIGRRRRRASSRCSSGRGGPGRCLGGRCRRQRGQDRGDAPENGVTLGPAVPDPPTVFLLAGQLPVATSPESGAPPVDKAKITPRPFIKPGTAVIGTGDPILIPADSDTLDYEIEIAAVIGNRRTHRCRGRRDGAHRRLHRVQRCLGAEPEDRRGPGGAQRRLVLRLAARQVVRQIRGGRAVPGHQRRNPAIRASWKWRSAVNGELRQHSAAGEMIFPMPEAIAFLSRFVTLRPGDLICMGTPGGVGEHDRRPTCNRATWWRPRSKSSAPGQHGDAMTTRRLYGIWGRGSIVPYRCAASPEAEDLGLTQISLLNQAD